MPSAPALEIAAGDGVTLAGEQAGEGPALVLLHGLTATRRYVVMGSHLLERSGLRVLAYDARGHGRSTAPAQAGDYGYGSLAQDLLAVLDAQGLERALLAGVSMGAHTVLRFALEHPERVAAVALITPAFEPEPEAPAAAAARLRGWDALAEGLRTGGVEGFLAAYDFAAVPQSWRETIARVIRQRLAEHAHPLAVADALEAVPRSRPFEDFEQLAAIAVPSLVIASRDEADPGHPLAVGERYAARLRSARLVVEDPGPPPRSPIAWQGGRVARLLSELAAEAF